MRHSRADAGARRQHGGQGACHEYVAKDTSVALYAVMFQYKFLSLGAFCCALLLVEPVQHTCLQRCSLSSACRRCTGR
jgi:hypothetical protein